jgi:hypothetical protein
MSSSTDLRGAWSRGVDEMGFWKYWLSTLTPERLQQQRQYDRERGKKYHEEHKEDRNKKAREWYGQNKERLSEEHECEVCGGHYTTHHRQQHCRTKRHQDMLARPPKGALPFGERKESQNRVNVV